MSAIRRFIAVWALAMVVCYAGGIAAAAAPAVDFTATSNTVTCTCAGGMRADCPMHTAAAEHPLRDSNAPREPHCCAGQPAGAPILLSTFVWWAGPLVTVSPAPAPIEGTRLPVVASGKLLDDTCVPVSPPPRAC